MVTAMRYLSSSCELKPRTTAKIWASQNPVVVVRELVRHGERGLIGSRLYDATSDENRAYFRKPRLAFVIFVALDDGNPVIASIDRKLGSRGECLVERRCDIIGPKDPYSGLGLAQGAD